MVGDRVYLFDTTLRDGGQTRGVDYTVADKQAIARALDEIGVDYIEGGWPGANPTDDLFFAAPPALTRAKLVAFGMTRRPGRSADNDPGLAAILNVGTPATCLVGKTWDFHVDVALEIDHDENLAMITDSIAAEAGARWVVLCNTNGGTLPHEVSEIVTAVTAVVPGARLGVHCHNDTENAVANSLAAVRAGCRQVQGTINGLGERCGNANLISLIPSLTLKMGLNTGIDADGLTALTRLSRFLDQRLDRVPNSHAAYVGAAAFAHKGGLHVSAVQKDPRTYEHIPPEAVGNRRYIVVSDQAGKSNILARLAELGIDVDKNDPQVGRLVEEIKTLEAHGYAFDEAEASFELMARGFLGQVPAFFEIERFRVMDERRFNARGQVVVESEATALVRIGGQRRHEVAVGNGPVNALDTALRKALEPLYPSLDGLRLLDYKVRILPPSAEGDGTDAVTRVMIESGAAAGQVWRTLGVSANIIDASVRALADSLTYKLMRDGVTPAVR